NSYKLMYSTQTYDTQGNAHSLDQYFVKTVTNTWSMYSLMDGRSISDPTYTKKDKNNQTFEYSGNLVTTAGGSFHNDSAD
ncbi:flagellar basal body FlgE domain-containing protein, partial [Pseudomonas syringae pv. tagetis]|uniref:flagellar basal body FlgE domain-containing protein n=1 Tax=Pseudomonas syringae group genomosp. 7 TaxID=251699 RepID=UPI0037702092